MSTRNQDQFFRVAYVAFRFTLLVAFTVIPFGGLIWWKTGSFSSSLPIATVILLLAIGVSFLDYITLGKKMREIEAKSKSSLSNESENMP